MKVRITGHSASDVAPWWYVDHIGEVFEVEEDDTRPLYYYTMRVFDGKLQKHGIKKIDCEVVE